MTLTALEKLLDQLYRDEQEAQSNEQLMVISDDIEKVKKLIEEKKNATVANR